MSMFAKNAARFSAIRSSVGKTTKVRTPDESRIGIAEGLSADVNWMGMGYVG